MKDDGFAAFVSKFEIPGDPTGPLAGLTFALKDLYDVSGHVTGAGNPEWARTHAPAQTTAPVVAKLLAAGATLCGKTHTDELAFSLMGVNAHYGTPRNPAAPDRVPGGSSSGSAVAAAAGLVDFAIGTDTGGSVRLPASFCGVFGIRPTHGRLPLTSVMALAPSFDTCGWFARDAAMMLRVAEGLGVDAADAGRGALPSLLMPQDLWALALPGVRDALAPMHARMKDLAGSCDDSPINPGGFDAWRDVFRICQGAEIWQVHGAWITSHEPRFGPGVAERFKAASQIGPEEAEAARRTRQEIAARLHDILSDGTIMAFPTSPGPAPLLSDSDSSIDKFRADALALLCSAGLAGLPQISIPAGLVDGAPVGFSLMGARGTDRELLELAALLTAKTTPQ